MTTNSENSSANKKVAIVVVHGVSDQPPHDSARSIANILLQNQKQKNHQYSVWDEQFIRIPVREIPKPKSKPLESRKGLSKSIFGWLDERGKRTRCLLDSEAIEDENLATAIPNKSPQNTQEIRENIDRRSHYFQCDYLDDYRPKNLKGDYYDTICLRSHREDGREVHLYEMYWADLSRLGRSFLQVFSEFYQILFHLCSLGRQTLDLTALEHPKQKMWWIYSSLHGWAGRTLSIPIQLLTIFMLVAVFLHLPCLISVEYSSYFAATIASVLLIACLGFALWNKTIKLPLPWLILPVITILSIFVIHNISNEFNYKLLTIEWLFILSATIGLIVSKYSSIRPGTSKIAMALATISILLTLPKLIEAEDSHAGIVLVSLQSIEIIYSLVVISWFAFFSLYLCVVIFGFLTPYWQNDRQDIQERKRIDRAKWTANISLWIPSVAFLVVTESLWAIVAAISLPLLPRAGNGEFEYSPSDWFRNWLALEETYKVSDFLNKIIVDPILGIALISIVFAILLAVWSFFPSILSEIFSPNAKRQQDKKLSINIGVWLNNGYQTIRFSLNLLAVIFIFLVWAYFAFRQLPTIKPFLEIFNSQLLRLTQILALSVTASASGIILFGKQLNQFSLGIRSIIDIILDVDNYLRLHPKDYNPRARIFARYFSLLRYLFPDDRSSDSQSKDRNKYDALIVVAHSQGTVITADLLRFIQKEKPTEVSLGKIYFFSMGSPLRQLYSVTFPHLYNWVSNYAEDYSNNLGSKPDPQVLGLQKWVNTYCSGDYVGRYLWRPSPSRDNHDLLFEPNAPSERGEYCEFCLGAGAHTHYWDGTDERVAEEINSLIDLAT
jgi:hypothetical protein